MIAKKHRTLLLLGAALAVVLVAATQFLNGWRKEDIGPLLREARIALAQSDFQRAGAVLDKILVQNPQHQEALLERGKLWALIGKHDDALQDWRSAGTLEGKGRSKKLASEARFLEGNLELSLKHARLAEQCLLEAWELDNDLISSLELLLRVYVLQMRGEETRRMLDRIEQRRKLSLEEMVLRVDAGGPIIDASQAIEQLQGFVSGDPEDIPSTIALLRYYLSSDRVADAQQLLSTLPTAVLGNSDVAGLRALCDLKRFAISEARQALHQPKPASQPPSYWWWMAAGELAEAESQACIAAESFQRAATLQPESGLARYRYGMALEACGNSTAAQEQLAMAAKMDRLHQHSAVITRMVGMAPAELAKTLLEIASLEHELGNPAEAARWARLALEIEPSNSTAEALARRPSTSPDSASTSQPMGAPVPETIAHWLAGETASIVSSGPSAPAEADASSSVRFEDVHETAQLDFQYFNGNTGSKYLIEAMGGGVSILDYDMDGWPDCYFPQGSQLPSDPQDDRHLDQLYRNLGGERFTNVTPQTRIVENGYSQGTAAADVNNDGFCDVVVANYGRSRLFINQGDGTFLDATDAWGLNETEMSSSIALADLDNDGNLDLYLVNYVDGIRVCRDSQGRISTCNPQNFLGVQDRLYRNSGESTFVDVTTPSGVVDTDGKGLGVVICDLDDDGWSDIYVANDTTPNLLFKNLGQMQFREMGLESGTALSPDGQAQAGMGIAAADFNGDLRTDLFVTNFYDESNNIYINRADMLFSDEAARGRIAAPSKPVLGFGAQAEDFDLDGHWDLIVANGHIDDFSYRGEPWKMPTQLFRNLGRAVFQACGTESGEYFRENVLGRGVASFDWNRDGRKDFIVVHQDRPVALLENRTVTPNHSLTVELIGKAANRDAIGAQVLVRVGEKLTRRDITGGDGFYTANQRRLCFGLGKAERPDSVTIRWPSGGEQKIAPVNLSAELQVLEEKE